MFAIIWKGKNEDGMTEKYSNYIRFLPILLGIWILWQVLALLQYNALSLFSWTQVINDTTMLLVPFSMGVLWFFLGKNDKHVNFWFFISLTRALITLLVWWMGFAILVIIIGLIGFPIQSINYKIYAILLIFYCIGLIVSFFVDLVDKNKKEPIKNHFIRNFFRPIVPFPLILILLVTLIFWWLGVYAYIYEWVNIRLHGETKNQQILYMNDKYILYGTGQFVINNPEYVTLIKVSINNK